MKQNTLTFFTFILILSSSCSPGKKEETVTEEETTEVIAAANMDAATESENKANIMYPTLSNYIASVENGMAAIPQERKEKLNKIAQFVQTKKEAGEPANLIFICTHNSRRSHLSQIWSATAAAHYGIDEGINTYSGGTEATAFNPRAVAAIERAGFKVQNPGGENPRYLVTYADNGQAMECFSKTYDDPANAAENFAAVMTCSDADKNCPFIPGASLRVAIPYVDPKESDGTEQEAATYDERCRQIATEMFYLMSQVKV